MKHFTHREFFSWVDEMGYSVDSCEELRDQGKTEVYRASDGYPMGTAFAYGCGFITFYEENN